jgi:GNAT superfamily N-acetyltransferase
MAGLVDAAYRHYVERIGRLPMPMQADHGAAIRDHEVWVVEAGEAGAAEAGIVAVLELIPAADHLFVENVAVAPGRQGGGLGRMLLDHAEAEAIHRGLPEIRLLTNERFVENLQIYARRGYRETARTPREGTDVVHLTKVLAPRS